MGVKVSVSLHNFGFGSSTVSSAFRSCYFSLTGTAEACFVPLLNGTSPDRWFLVVQRDPNIVP